MKCFGQLKTATVWLVLLGFLCGMMVPSVVMGKVFRDIDMEGDPGDGNESSSGGGDGLIISSESSDAAGVSSPSSEFRLDYQVVFVRFVPVMHNGIVVFYLDFSSSEFIK